MKKLFYILLAACLLLTSCATPYTVPFEVHIPDAVPMPEDFSTDRIVTDVQGVEDIVNNLLVYEGRMNWYKARSEALESYLDSLSALALSVEE